MRWLITGGYGCIGSWIVKNLIERGETVFIFDVREEPKRLNQILDEGWRGRVEHISGDVSDLHAVRSALERERIEKVIHLAGLQVPLCRANPMHGALVNVIGTLAVFEAVLALRRQIDRVVYASSSAVFGPPEDYFDDSGYQPLADDAVLRPTTHYGVFKWANENNARIYWQDQQLPSVGLRPWTVYGVGRDFGMTSEPTKAIKSVALGRPYAISYGGMQDLQYVDDVAKTFIRVAEAPFEGCGVFNLRGAVVDLATFHRTLAAIEPRAAELVTFGHRQLPIAFDLSDDGLREAFGPMPSTPLADGLARTLEQFRRLHHAGRLDLSDLPAG
jgi:nucleoside-diphosphate-sugar epimerase